MTFGEILRYKRKLKGISQRELAEKTGVDFTYISHIERNKVLPPSEELIKKFAKILNEDVDLLLGAAGRVDSLIIELLASNPELVKEIRNRL